MPRLLRRSVAALPLVAVAVLASTTAATVPRATAATSKCRVISSASVGGFDWRPMPTGRACSNTLRFGVAGVAHLSQRTITVQYSERASTTTQVAKATVHELAHNVEYRTTAAHRARLYHYLAVQNPTGDYFAIDDRQYLDGSLAHWKRSPRERLAESVVNCTFGSPNHVGMRLVPRSQCGGFLWEFRASLAAAR